MSDEKEKTKLKDWLLPIFIALTGVFASLKISCSQIESAKEISLSQQRFFAVQFFSDKLKGNRIERDLALGLIRSLDDPTLTENLTDISNRVTIELNADSIWGKTVNGREDAIKEYAKLYKKYPSQVMGVLKETMPDTAHINYWAPVISISKFFHYLTEYGDGKWKGTKEDSLLFATLKNSRFYKHPIEPDSANVRKYLKIGLRNFIDTTDQN